MSSASSANPVCCESVVVRTNLPAGSVKLQLGAPNGLPLLLFAVMVNKLLLAAAVSNQSEKPFTLLGGCEETLRLMSKLNEDPGVRLELRAGVPVPLLKVSVLAAIAQLALNRSDVAE